MTQRSALGEPRLGRNSSRACCSRSKHGDKKASLKLACLRRHLVRMERLELSRLTALPLKVACLPVPPHPLVFRCPRHCEACVCPAERGRGRCRRGAGRCARIRRNACSRLTGRRTGGRHARRLLRHGLQRVDDTGRCVCRGSAGTRARGCSGKNSVASTAVVRDRNEADPRAPNTVPEAPAPKPAPASAPRPRCSSTSATIAERAAAGEKRQPAAAARFIVNTISVISPRPRRSARIRRPSARRPPTRPPSMSGIENRSRAFDALTLPPYRTRTDCAIIPSSAGELARGSSRARPGPARA